MLIYTGVDFWHARVIFVSVCNKPDYTGAYSLKVYLVCLFLIESVFYHKNQESKKDGTMIPRPYR